MTSDRTRSGPLSLPLAFGPWHVMHSAIYVVLPRSAAAASTVCLSPGPGPVGGAPRAPVGAWAAADKTTDKMVTPAVKSFVKVVCMGNVLIAAQTVRQ